MPALERQHPRAGPTIGRDEPLGGERSHRLTQGIAADPKRLAQAGFDRQVAAGQVVSPQDRLTDPPSGVRDKSVCRLD